MSAREKKNREALVKRMSLTDEAKIAYLVADHSRVGIWDSVGAFVGTNPTRLRLVADALEDAPRLQPTPTRLNIVAAWLQAYFRAGAAGGRGFKVFARPTLFEVKIEFVRLFVPNADWPKDWSRKAMRALGHNLLPSRQTFEKTLKGQNFGLRKDTVRRPRNSLPK